MQPEARQVFLAGEEVVVVLRGGGEKIGSVKYIVCF